MFCIKKKQKWRSW